MPSGEQQAEQVATLKLGSAATIATRTAATRDTAAARVADTREGRAVPAKTSICNAFSFCRSPMGTQSLQAMGVRLAQ